MKSKGGRFDKYGEIKQTERISSTKGKNTRNGRDVIKNDKHRKIAPKHPNSGRR